MSVRASLEPGITALPASFTLRKVTTVTRMHLEKEGDPGVWNH
jgi:hypothetical protein